MVCLGSSLGRANVLLLSLHHGVALLREQPYFAGYISLIECTPSSAHMLRHITLGYYYLLEGMGHPFGFGICWVACGLWHHDDYFHRVVIH